MRLTLVRHGETTSNAAGRWQGQGDARLSDLGRRQAEQLAERLDGATFDRVVSSDLSRARETAEALGRPFELGAGFREIDLGAWEGLTREEVHERFPDELAAMARGEIIPVGGGESWADVERRTIAAVERLEGERVLLIAHGGVILTLMCALVGAPVGTPRPLGRLLNTSITEIDLGTRVVHRYNDAFHADPEGVLREAAKRRNRVDVVRSPPDLGVALAALPDDRVGMLETTRGRTTVAAWNVVAQSADAPRPR